MCNECAIQHESLIVPSEQTTFRQAPICTKVMRPYLRNMRIMSNNFRSSGRLKCTCKNFTFTSRLLRIKRSNSCSERSLLRGVDRSNSCSSQACCLRNLTRTGSSVPINCTMSNLKVKSVRKPMQRYCLQVLRFQWVGIYFRCAVRKGRAAMYFARRHGAASAPRFKERIS